MDLIGLGDRLAGEAAGNCLAHERAVRGSDQIGHVSADELLRAETHRLGRIVVREYDALAMHEHDVRHRVRQALEQCFALAHLRVFRRERIEELVDHAAEIVEFRRQVAERDAFAERSRFRRLDDVVVHCSNLPGIAPPAAPEQPAGTCKAQAGQYQQGNQPGFDHAL